jgi:hypothetical protein
MLIKDLMDGMHRPFEKMKGHCWKKLMGDQSVVQIMKLESQQYLISYIFMYHSHHTFL